MLYTSLTTRHVKQIDRQKLFVIFIIDPYPKAI